MSQYLMQIVGYQVQHTAEWRRNKTAQFPDDDRNVRAAEELDLLAAQIEQVEGDSPIHKQVEKALGEIVDADDDVGDTVSEDVGEAVSAELRAIGFHAGYATAQSFLEWYRDLLCETLRHHLDQDVELDLHEQVENDPAVKAAKQAYDEAYAKAYAEARKARSGGSDASE